MPLVPLTLEQMIKLNNYCSTSHALLAPVASQDKNNGESGREMMVRSFGLGILETRNV